MAGKKDKILDATIKLFLREGFRKATMEGIAGAAMASKVTVYKYFSDKDALLAAAAERMVSSAVAALESAVASHGGIVQKMHDFLACVCAFVDSGRFGLCEEMARYGDGAGGQFDRYDQVYRAVLAGLVDEGLAQGIIRSGLDRDMVCHAVDMGVVYYRSCPAYRTRMRNDGDYRRRFMGFLVGNVFADADSVAGVEEP